MKAQVSIGGRLRAGETRLLSNWVGKLHLNATSDDDQYILAAINRALHGDKDEAKELRAAIMNEANKCKDDHLRYIKKD